MQNQNNGYGLTNGEWVMHDGNATPPDALMSLKHGDFVEVEFRDSTRTEVHRDSLLSVFWGNKNNFDVVAYRINRYALSVIDHEREQETEVETLKRQLGAALDDKEHLKNELANITNMCAYRLNHFQERVVDWVKDCFGSEIASCRPERNHRFLEEALELVQALGCTRDESHQLVDYVFDRPVGSAGQEVGGVMVTLAALCGANELNMGYEAEIELGRICAPEIKEKIRLKQAAKPAMSPLPEYPAREPYKVVASTIDSYIKKIEKLERDNEALREHNESMKAHLNCDHPDDRAVNAFANAIKIKMAVSRANGRSGWDKPEECSSERLAELLIDQFSKPDPVDIGAYAMMLHQRGDDGVSWIFETALKRIDTGFEDWPLAVKSYMDSVPCVPDWGFDEEDPNLTMFNFAEAMRQYANRIEHETRNLDVAVNYVKFLHINRLGTSFSTFIDQFKYEKEGAEIAFKFCEEFMGAVNFLLLTLSGKQLYVSHEALAMGGSLGLSQTIDDHQSHIYPPNRHEPRMQRPDHNTKQVMLEEPRLLILAGDDVVHDRRKTDGERKCYLQSPAVIPGYTPSENKG